MEPPLRNEKNDKMQIFRRCNLFWKAAERAKSENNEERELRIVSSIVEKLDELKKRYKIVNFSKNTYPIYDLAKERLQVLQESLHCGETRLNSTPVLPPIQSPKHDRKQINYEEIRINLEKPDKDLLMKISQLETQNKILLENSRKRISDVYKKLNAEKMNGQNLVTKLKHFEGEIETLHKTIEDKSSEILRLEYLSASKIEVIKNLKEKLRRKQSWKNDRSSLQQKLKNLEHIEEMILCQICFE